MRWLLGIATILALCGFTLIGQGKVQTYVGIEDVYGVALGCWSLRACSASNADAHSKAIRLTRASDSTTQDIAVLSSGDLDVSTANTFCAATTCTVTTWYDQSGSGAVLTVPSGQAAPAFTFNAIGSLPAALFNGSTTCLEYATGIPNTVGPVVYSMFTEPQMATTHNVNYVVPDSVTGGNQGWQVDGFGSNAFYAFAYGTSTPANVTSANNATHSAQLYMAASAVSSSVTLDGTTTGLAFSYTGGSIQIGGADSIGCDIGGTSGPYTSFFKGYVTEVADLALAPTAPQLALANMNQTNYWSPPLSAALIGSAWLGVSQ
jgi:hypothetical protein